MLKRLAPDTLRKIPEQYNGIYVHGTQIETLKNLVCLSGQIGVAPDGTTHTSFKDQCNQAIDNVEALLSDVDMTTSDIMRVTYFVTSPDDLDTLSLVRQSRWNHGHAPAVTTLVVAALAAPDLLVEIEVTAAK